MRRGKGPPLWGGWPSEARSGEGSKKYAFYPKPGKKLRKNLIRLQICRCKFESTFPKGEGS